jgi:hypothetical protein
MMTLALNYADALSALGGIDVDWVVHSPTHDTNTKVKEAWVDDEWDTQRRRGQRATKRITRAQSG